MGKKPKFDKLLGQCAASFDEATFKTLIEIRQAKLEGKIAANGPSKRLVKLEIGYGLDMAMPLLAEEQVRTRLALKQAEMNGEPIHEEWAQFQGRQAVHMKYGQHLRVARPAHGEAASVARGPEYVSYR